LGDLSDARDWSDARDVVNAMWLSLQVANPADYVLASGIQRKVEDFVAAAFRVAGLDWHAYVKFTSRTTNKRQVTTSLCGNTHKAEAVLGWKRQWSFEAMVADLVTSELENRSEMERANSMTKLPSGPT
jgi:GDPmannose 4,6-dehydratase